MIRTRIVLAGGPEQLPEAVRIQEVGSLKDKVKVHFASGYEHFTHSGEVAEVDGDHLPVFQWCGQTRIAE
jgi:hypothetical protein